MNLPFADKNIIAVASPVDLRAGFGKLSSFARDGLAIDLSKGEDVVVFMNGNASLCKMVACDSTGSIILSRRLHQGRFGKLLMHPDGKAYIKLTAQELENLLDGKPLMVRRRNFLKG